MRKVLKGVHNRHTVALRRSSYRKPPRLYRQLLEVLSRVACSTYRRVQPCSVLDDSLGRRTI